MGQTPKTDYTAIGDIVVNEYSPVFCRETKTITNSSGAVMDLVPGTPMDDNVPVIDGTEANTDGLLLERVYLENGEVAKAAVLARGPAVINQDAIPLTDYAGDTMTLATIVTALESLEDIVCREEPSLSETQDT